MLYFNDSYLQGNYSAALIFVRSGCLMYKIVPYGGHPERTCALLNSYRTEFIRILRDTLNSYRLPRVGGYRSIPLDGNL